MISAFNLFIPSKLILFKVLSNNRFAFAFFNLTDNDCKLDAYFPDYGLPYYSGFGLRLKDVMTGEDLGVRKDFLSVALKQHSCKIFIATLEK